MRSMNQTLSNKQKKQLKGLGHSLQPVVMIADQGLKETVVAATNEALDTHELIKIKISDTNSPLPPLSFAEELSAKDPTRKADPLAWPTFSGPCVRRCSKNGLIGERRPAKQTRRPQRRVRLTDPTFSPSGRDLSSDVTHWERLPTRGHVRCVLLF